ncbi:ABC transporter permease [Actinoplanes subtropicus]|uniref:ABC transporter permease n=1 Tax=Actinoplanes subtropicus TaxID=543632 RepID=UPI0004C395B7|nr:ABC transporter permease [Actinoplanes subtropicus]
MSNLITGRAGVPFGRQLRAELRKLIDTRAGRWLLIVIFSVMPAVVAGMLIIARPATLTYSQFIDVTSSPERIILPILGILTVTTEWSQRTGLLTFTLEPNRRRVLLAKATATLLLGIAVIAVGFLSAAIGNLLGVALRDGAGDWTFGVGGYRDIVVVLLVGLLQGLAYGMLLLGSAAAIVVYYVVPNLSSLLFTAVSGLKEAASWLDLQKAQAAIYLHDVTAREWAQYATAALIWVVLPGVLGFVRVLRSEIKSG